MFYCQNQSLDYINNANGSKTVNSYCGQSCTDEKINELLCVLESDTACILYSVVSTVKVIGMTSSSHVTPDILK